MKYVEVILPLPLESAYTYSIPVEMEPVVRKYCLVKAPFGKKRYYTAIVKEIHDQLPDSSIEYKELSAVLNERSVIYPRQMQFWDWIASYYLCKTGEVFKAAVPPGIINNEYVSKKELLKASGMSVSILDGLIKQGILESYENEISRFQLTNDDCPILNVLTEAQHTAFDEIQAVFRTKPVCLLHGIAACGKTEIYIHLIQNTLHEGAHVLYLLPEIAVTKKITKRMTSVFGDRLVIYHSGFSDNKRVEIWNRIRYANDSLVVVGVRSSLFLPFANLGLVIVDEEHDTSYLQQDPAPRYHARNAAIMLAHIYGARTLLGSATPSLESYYNAKSGKYGLVALNVPYENKPNPLIHIANVKDLKRRKIMKESLFSPLMKEKMEEALKGDAQIVLFQNRRGFALVMECKTCGDVVRCINCDVSLTCHRHSNRLICHYCGYAVALPTFCPSCGKKELKLAGFGTEKVEEEIEMLFPGVLTSRLDYDTARTHSAYERILSCFEQGKSKILIGTQMLAKGLNLKQVGVVGVLNADSLMNVPNFRSHERAFQLIMQISSFAGRYHNQGTVVIQTSQPDHPLIQAVQAFDYTRMAVEQLIDRKTFRYPPYYRLIVLVLRCSNEQRLEQIAARYAEILYEALGERVILPFAPPVNRVQALYIRHIMLKLETSFATAHVRAILDKANCQMQSLPGFSRIVLHYEVDN